MKFLASLLLVCILFSPGCSDDKKRKENPHLRALNRGFKMKTEAAFKGLITAISQYSIDTGERPEVSDMDELCSILKPVYISQCFPEDGWGTIVKCEISSDDESYFLSAGMDRVFGTEDDIKLIF